MTGREILKEIRERRTANLQFIKWWRKEEDWLDYDLIDIFLENVDPDEVIDGFDLISMDDMWDNLVKVTSGRVERDKRRGEEVIVWRKESGEEQICPYNAASVMTIFDVETHGDVID